MAKISVYPEKTFPTYDDYLVGTDVSDSLATKNFLITDILQLVEGSYKNYVSLLSQAGANPPSDTNKIIINTLGEDIGWGYMGVGTYTGLLRGAFVAGKTVVFNNIPNSNFQVSVIRESINNILITTRDLAGNLVNGAFSDMSLEIRVYN